MTAGSGVIHNEDATSKGSVRLLQFWLTLPKCERWVPPAFWRIPLDSVPIRRETGVQMRVYSDSSGGYASRACAHVPVTLVDIELGVGATLE
jgi:redox-sensitive bicupin YhaK (pirin superfamily)